MGEWPVRAVCRRSAAPPPTWLLVVVMGAAGLVVYSQQSVVIPLIPSLPIDYGVDAATASWAVTSTIIVGATSTPVLSRLGDLFGIRRILLISVVCSVVGAAACAVTSDFGIFIAGRVVAGGALAAQPLTLSVIRHQVPAEKLPGAVATMGATAAIGVGAGPILAGFVGGVQDTFWVLTALGALAFVLVRQFSVEVDRGEQAPRVDYVGALLLTVLVLLALVPLTMGNEWGWGSYGVWACVAGVVVAAVTWVPHELRHPAPFLDLRMNARGTTLLSHLAAGTAGFMMFGNALVVATMLQAPKETGYGFGYSLHTASFAYILGAACMALSTPLASWLLRRTGAHGTMMVATSVIGVFYLARIPLHGTLAGLMVSFGAIYAAVSIAISALAVIGFQQAPRDRVAEVMGTQQVVRLTGQAGSSSVIGLVSGWLVVRVGGDAHPSWEAIVVCSLAGAAAALVCLVLVSVIAVRRRGSARSGLDAVTTARAVPTSAD